MIAAALLTLLVAQAPPTAIAPAATVSAAAVAAPPPAPDPQKIADDLSVVYDQSCGGRIYGTFAQACNGLAEQLARAQAEARKAARAKPVKSPPGAVAGR